ncbi:acyltransferase [Xanthobacter autotrophicus]|uniref:acyltransferase family protein n=1 Tax=Xanthobacter TaxID=279 RepID=UPI0024AAD688|nr:acyltransferase [Xanthobacter autotrophicus]MDI4665719.1 acyltransferase [Xanthobacter autotrophicus]
MKPTYLVNVQILRFFAAALVVFAHVGVEVGNVAARTGRVFEEIGLIDWGLGVDVFFIISGFIMYYMMHDRFGAPGAPVDFLRRRLIRIVPLYWICTTLMLASLVAAPQLINNNGLDLKHVVASYTFIPWPRADGELFPILSLGWTLNYEMLFYAIFALVLLLPRRAGLVALGAAFILLILTGILVPDRLFMLKFWGNPIIGEFLLGTTIAALFLDGRRISGGAAVALVVAGIALAVVFFQASAYEHIWRLVTGGIPAALIVAAAVLGPPLRETWPARALALGGDASYALYLTHPFTIKLFGVAGAKVGLPLGAIYVVGLVLTVLVSVAVHLLVEKPIGQWLMRKTSGPKRAVRAAS